MRVGDGSKGWLVLNDTWFSGWSATVGGRAVPIVRANLSMRALRIPAGEQTVVFRYEAPRFAMGATISIVTLGVALLFVVLGFRRRERQPEPEAA